MQTVSYMGNGQITEFHFNFPYYDNTNIVVTKNNKPATDYEIIGTSNGPNADIPFSGGKVVFEVAPKASDSISISRELPLSRIVDYQPTEKINPTVLNQDLNYIIELMKDINGELSRFRSQYSDFTDQESAQILLAKMAATSAAIENLGDIASINSSLATLNNRTNNLLDYVVASQLPTAENGHIWYRKYKSGWVEQGGSKQISITNDSGNCQVQLPIIMQNTNYFAVVQGGLIQGQSYLMYDIEKNSNSTINLIASSKGSVPSGAVITNWEVKGMAA